MKSTSIINKIGSRIKRLHRNASSNTGQSLKRSVRVAERLALPTSVHGVAGSNLTGGENLPEPKRRFINLGESVCKQNFSFCGKLVSTAW